MSAKKYAKIHNELTEAKKENENKLRVALKRHIMRERERKKQQELETAKEEQLRNEREARKKQDNIRTLGKTQEEIQQVEEQMIQLKNKKHQLFLQLKALITKEVEMEKIRKEADLMNVRNDVGGGLPYQPYNNDKGGVKRPHSPLAQDYYKHNTGQPQRLYLSPKTDAPGRLWYNTAKYAQAQPAPWPMGTGNRYTLQSTVPAPPPHPILISHTDHQQPPPQLVKQHQSQQPPASQPAKTNSISIEKISGPPQADFTIHRRLLPPSTQAPPPGQTFYAPGISYPDFIAAQNREFQNK